MLAGLNNAGLLVRGDLPAADADAEDDGDSQHQHLDARLKRLQRRFLDAGLPQEQRLRFRLASLEKECSDTDMAYRRQKKEVEEEIKREAANINEKCGQHHRRAASDLKREHTDKLARLREEIAESVQMQAQLSQGQRELSQAMADVDTRFNGHCEKIQRMKSELDELRSVRAAKRAAINGESVVLHNSVLEMEKSFKNDEEDLMNAMTEKTKHLKVVDKEFKDCQSALIAKIQQVQQEASAESSDEAAILMDEVNELEATVASLRDRVALEETESQARVEQAEGEKHFEMKSLKRNLEKKLVKRGEECAQLKRRLLDLSEGDQEQRSLVEESKQGRKQFLLKTDDHDCGHVGREKNEEKRERPLTINADDMSVDQKQVLDLCQEVKKQAFVGFDENERKGIRLQIVKLRDLLMSKTALRDKLAARMCTQKINEVGDNGSIHSQDKALEQDFQRKKKIREDELASLKVELEELRVECKIVQEEQDLERAQREKTIRNLKKKRSEWTKRHLIRRPANADALTIPPSGCSPAVSPRERESLLQIEKTLGHIQQRRSNNSANSMTTLSK